ncbi:MAG: VOC family protein [Kiloniellales bacterium]|nr:VOC family protein [Kiloniellales bacterium]
MPLRKLDHVNIRTSSLECLRRFYEEVVGLEAGPRPPFSMGGAWLYCGDMAAVHLVEVEKTPDCAAPRLEHFAFQAEGLPEFRQHLEDKAVEYELSIIPGWHIRQLHFRDPDGNHIEISFAAEEPLD